MIERLEKRRLWSVTAMYTYAGDASFDYNGNIDSDDYFIIDASYINTGSISGTGNITKTGGGILTSQVDGNPLVPPTPRDVNGTAKNDRILVFPKTFGQISISVNGNVTDVASNTPLHILANNGDDVVWIDPALGSSVAVTIYGGAGDDTILLAGGNDRVFAGEGNDEVNGGGGNDTIYGDAGDDSVRGGGGSDNLDSGDGADTLRGDGGNDRLVAGANPDRLRGSLGNDTLEGGGGRDLLGGEGGDDSLDGGNGVDVVDGGAGADVLRGGGDQDVVVTVLAESDDIDYAEVSAGEVLESMTSSSGITTNTAVNYAATSDTLIKTGAGKLTLTGMNTFSGSTTISGGTLNIAASSLNTAAGNPRVMVSSGAVITFDAESFSKPEMDVEIRAGGALSFGNVTGSATLGSLKLANGAYLTFNLGGSANNVIHLTKADGLSADGAIIKLQPASFVVAGTRTLLTFTPGASPVNFTLAPVRDTEHSYVLNVDAVAGVVTVDVAHV